MILIFLARRDPHCLGKILLMQTVRSPKTADPVCFISDYPIVARCREQYLSVGTAAYIYDKAVGRLNAELFRRPESQLLIHDNIPESHMALFHDMCARCRSLGQIPSSGIRFIIQTDFTGGAGEGEMTLHNDIYSLRSAFPGKLLHTRVIQKLIASLLRRKRAVRHLKRAETFAAKRREDGKIVIFLHLQSGGNGSSGKPFREEPFKKGFGPVLIKCLLLKRQAHRDRSRAFHFQVGIQITEAGPASSAFQKLPGRKHLPAAFN